MAQNKNHHFVPQFYLRRFGADRFVALYNIARGQHVPRASIAGQCQRPYLYGKDQVIEKALCELEGAAARIIADIVERHQLPAELSKKDAALLRFISYQWGRTPAAGEIANAMVTKMSQAILKAPGVVPDDLRQHIDEVDVRHADPVLFSLTLAGSLGPMLLDLHKVILVNETELEFITSDAPVIMHNAWCEGVTWQGTTGFASSGLQILLPLSPRRALLMFDRDVYAVGCKQAPVTVDIMNAADVEAINAMQMTTTQGNIYYSGDARTASSIDRLPRSWYQPAGTSVAVQRAIDDDAGSQLVHLYQKVVARLPLSFLRVKKKASSVPLKQRARQYRQLALAVDEMMRGLREQRYAAPETAIGRVWKGVPD
ncbi:MAG: DUF4238 domain-containing protein [Myxococcales bacterium]